MRDLDRWKDKVELSLDGRQIFFLFFGSAVAACLIFVLGVLIGKRLEARALALQPAPVEDPLAALDQLGEADEADEGLTFHKALTGSKKVEAPVKEKKEPEPVIAVKPVNVNVNVNANENVNASVSEPKPAVAAAPAKKPDVKPAPPLPAGKPQVVAGAAASSHFTLQLSAFPDKSDAEEFMKKIQSAGYKPFLVSSEIPGKGVFYRVRVGDYGTRQAAVDAKSEFERKQRMIAYVAKL
jgi:cell division septation protein DedD